ncbi:polymorphic toxin type 24 domain-containing protein [Saccharopolyspora sp. CA-218241]|uniref:WXG100-like domain-containing protein n=1 Tax=Saccharopolyspora sp. CA-218241 TaxID=3240027 RepID=UPI003D96C081
MSVALPGELAALLAEVGEPWPEADEDRLRGLADGWRRTGDRLAELRDRAAPPARAVAAHNRGRAVDAFTARWAELEPRVALGAAAAHQVATAVDALATATGVTKGTAVEVLAAGHAQRERVRHQAAGAVVAPLISTLLRMLANALRPLLRRLGQLLRSVARTVLDVAKRAFQSIVDFVESLFGPEPPPPPPVPPPPPPPEYRRDGPLPHARELIANGSEWTEPGRGRGGRKLPKEADPNQVLFLRNPPGTGSITSYSVYDERGFIIKRVDIVGTHGGMTGHVHEFSLHTNPKTGEVHVGQSEVRNAEEHETDYR